MICDPLHLFEIVSPDQRWRGDHRRVAGNRQARRNIRRCGCSARASSRITRRSPTRRRSRPRRSKWPPRTHSRWRGCKPKDMHLVCPYDCYTITVIVSLEDAGFCKKGQGGPFVAEHDLTYAGDFPCNTHGGQLSFGQPGLAGGMSHVTEGDPADDGTRRRAPGEKREPRLRQRQRRNHERTGQPDSGATVMSEYFKPLPKPTPSSRPFWEAAKKPRAQAAEMRRVQPVHLLSARAMPQLLLRSAAVAAGERHAASSTATRPCIAPRRDRSFDKPYVLAIVELEEGPADDDQHRAAPESV